MSIAKMVQRALCHCSVFAAYALGLPSANVTADTLDNALIAVKTRAEPPLFPRALFSKQVTLQQAALSPNGQYLAYVLNDEGKKQVRLLNLTSQQQRTLFRSKILKELHWSRDGSFIFIETIQGIGVIPMETPDQPEHIINLDAKKGDTFYGVDQAHPHAVLVSVQSEERSLHTVHRILPNGVRTTLHTYKGYFSDYISGGVGQPNFALQLDRVGFAVLRIEQGKTHRLHTCAITDKCSLLSYSPLSQKLYMRGRFGEDLVGLYEVDPHTGANKRIHSEPSGQFDLHSAKIDGLTGLPMLAGYKDDYTSFYGLTTPVIAALERLENRLSAGYFNITPNADLSTWLVVDQSADQPSPALFVYKIGPNETSTPINVQYNKEGVKGLRGHLAPRVPIWYTVSDGMRQQGYVTLPLGKNPAAVPLVVVPHGGPWGRVDGSFDTRAQFLANRGYAVFEPNFRASDGFGYQYMVSGRREFGNGRIQQDIIDGTNHVLSRGIGDPQRLAIFGHSFGGFSVLGALAFTPETFLVGIAGAPPADLTKVAIHYRKFSDSPDFRLGLEFFKDQAVDPDDPVDVQNVHKKSPDFHWQKVKKPLYIWAGGADPKISVLDVRDYAQRLQQAGRPVTYLEEPAAGHSPEKYIAREAYLYMVEKALAAHLKGRTETLVSKQLHRHLKRITVFDENHLLQ